MLNKKTQYALQALKYLVEHQTEGPVLIAEIASKKQIPLKFLENILLELKRLEVLSSKKGKGGGYFIHPEAIQTPLDKIIRNIEGPIAMLPCASLYFYERCENCNEKNCGLHETMVAVRDATLQVLGTRTVQDLAGGSLPNP
ncbi:MAG: Rrf2 family transcriptional regulator [Algoriphagus sp.]|jgi:Rrf2 family protein|nr:Rrf2 family transcriptional regulator [Algoriphagus sp.]